MATHAMIESILWGLLLAIGVSDAQRHRIPNYFVICLFLVVLVLLVSDPNVGWLEHMKGFGMTFIVCFALYLLKVMAGGDVKLLAVIGLWLGASQMQQAVPSIILSGGVVAMFYLAQHIASSPVSFAEQAKAYAVQKVTPGWKSKQPLVIPFAPAIVIGLAYFFYIH